jgi:type VI secretion system secreted protein Hcp
MSTTMFLKIDGIKGGSAHPRHAGEIDLFGFTFGGVQTKLAVANGLSEYTETTPSMHDITVTKYADVSSPRIWEAIVKGERFSLALMTLERLGSDGALRETILIAMKDVSFTTYQTGGSNSRQETLTLGFASVQISYAV